VLPLADARRTDSYRGDRRAAAGVESDVYFAERRAAIRLARGRRCKRRTAVARDARARYREYEARFDGAIVPRPSVGGFRVVPGSSSSGAAADRLHDRVVYTWEGDRWALGRLYP
jgi:pyridoxine/pyridoxamine 5'-phosphate oxidase